MALDTLTSRKMTTKEPILLCDFGGTHGRLGVLKGGKIHDLKKYELADFDSHIDLFEAYSKLAGHNFQNIAVAAAEGTHFKDDYPSGFKQNSKISAKYFQTHSYSLCSSLNDFEASAWGVPNYKGNEIFFKQGIQSTTNEGKCLIGPGTGLACAFIYEANEIYDVKSVRHGGHMRPCTATSEQRNLIKALQSNQNTAVIYEDIVSGRGLKKLCELYNCDSNMIFREPNKDVNRVILRLFHEFLGLYIQNVLVTTANHGGVILHGGLMDVIYEAGVFNFDMVDQMINQPYVASVANALQQTPISYIQDTYLALYGLKNYLEAVQDA